MERKYNSRDLVWFMRWAGLGQYKPTQAVVESLHVSFDGIPYCSILFPSNVPNNSYSKGVKESELFRTEEECLNSTLEE